MSARTEFEPLSWEEAEENRQTLLPAEKMGFRNLPAPEPENLPGGLGSWQTLQDRCDRLRNEIKRGKECLEQVRRDLAELRARLEDWPAYERSCGRNPLAHYSQSLLVNERVEQFLPGWLERREERLASANRELELAARQHAHEGKLRAHSTLRVPSTPARSACAAPQA